MSEPKQKYDIDGMSIDMPINEKSSLNSSKKELSINKCLLKNPLKRTHKIENRRKRYYLGNKYPRIYLTSQEATCLIHLMDGITNKDTALAMNCNRPINPA